jgi:hypothetical protein
MRRQGKSILFVHHSGKGGGQRGSSKREDTLDVVIHLRKPENYSPSEGARFEVHFEKFRHGFGDEARPFEVRLTQDADGTARWDWEYLKESMGDDEIVQLLSQGISQTEIARRVGCHKSTVCRVAKRALAQTRAVRPANADLVEPEMSTMN